MDDDDADRFLEELRTTTRPVFPQLVSRLQQQGQEGKGKEGCTSYLFTYAWLALCEPQFFERQPVAVIAQGSGYLANYLVAKTGGLGEPPADVRLFLLSWAEHLCHQRQGNEQETENIAQALCDALWTGLGMIMAGDDSGNDSSSRRMAAVRVCKWILSEPGLKGVCYGPDRLHFFPFTGLFTLGTDATAFVRMLPADRYPADPRHLVIPVTVQRDLNDCAARGREDNWQCTFLNHSLSLALITGTCKALLTHWTQGHVVRNWSRGQLHVQYRAVCTDHYALQLEHLWLNFCQPFLGNLAKFGTISVRYSSATDVDVDLRQLLLVAATPLDKDHGSDQADDGEVAGAKHDNGNEKHDSHQERDNGSNSFVSHCFWLTLLLMNQGTGLLQRTWQTMMRELADVSADIAARPVVDERTRQRLHRLLDEKLVLDFYLLDPHRLDLVLEYLAFLGRFLQHLHDEGRPDYGRVPEFAVELLLDLLAFYGQHAQHPLIVRRLLDEPFWPSFLVSFLNNRPVRAGHVPESSASGEDGKWTGNPYLRSKVLGILPAFPFAVFDVKSLLGALIGFYVHVEGLETSTGFYDKYNMRYQMTDLMLRLWSDDGTRARNAFDDLARQGLQNVMSPFVRFVNLLLGDVTFLLDESFGKLQELHDRSQQNSRAEEGGDMAERLEQLRTQATLERQCRSLLQLANVSTDLLDVLTRHLPQAFSRPEIVPRLTAMLNLSTLQLAGPQCRQLKVAGASERYQFRPRELLCKLANILVNMRQQSDFVRSLRSDARAFRPAVLRRVVALTGNAQLDDLLGHELVPLPGEREDVSSRGIPEEEEDVPDEFLDQLMFTVMDDPVRLPSSQVVVDRSTIIGHLLNKSTDPFDRSSLTVDQLIDLPDLQERIRQWRLQNRK